MLGLLYLILISICDRVRGGGVRFSYIIKYKLVIPFIYKDIDIDINYDIYKIFRKICQFSYGFLTGWVLSGSLILSALTSVLFWLGEKPSWRGVFNEISGAKIEEEFLPLRLMFRGFTWVTCITFTSSWWKYLPAVLGWGVVYYLNPIMLGFMFMAPAFALSAYWGYRWQSYFDKHAFVEWTRPILFGLGVLGVAYVG